MKHIRLFLTAIATTLLMSSFVFAQETAVTVTETGNVGIGTTNPGFELDVFESTDDRARVGQMEMGGWPLNTQFFYIGNQSLDQTVNGNYALIQSDTGGTIVNSAAGTALHLSIDNGLHTVLTPDGRMGIGELVPSARLDVDGTINASTQYNIGGDRGVSVAERRSRPPR